MFPFATEIPLSANQGVHFETVLNQIGPLLTEPRRARIDQVVEHRNFGNAVVLEGIYDRGNISAVMRTAEGLGFANFHVVETQEKFKEANRVTQGADKWVEVQKWKSTKDAVHAIKKQGHRIVVTSLEASRPISEIDFTRPTALVLGNEKEGVSPEMLEAADERVIIPMNGFVQSFNISVAGALCLYHIFQYRLQKLGQVGDLTVEQKIYLKLIITCERKTLPPKFWKEFYPERPWREKRSQPKRT